jgi:hypothetical protein
MKIQERPALIYVEANIIASYGRVVINELYQYISFCLWKCVDLTACNKWHDCFSFLIFFVFGLVNAPCKASYIKQAVSQCFFARHSWFMYVTNFNPLNPELNPICYLLALLRAHHFLHVSRIRVKLLTFRILMSYIYIYIYIWSTHSWCF